MDRQLQPAPVKGEVLTDLLTADFPDLTQGLIEDAMCSMYGSCIRPDTHDHRPRTKVDLAQLKDVTPAGE